ncbi:unnamed protein product [Boreogadus saida]
MAAHSSWVKVATAGFTKARVVMMASLSLTKRFNMKNVEFHRVGQSCRTFRSQTTIFASCSSRVFCRCGVIGRDMYWVSLDCVAWPLPLESVVCDDPADGASDGAADGASASSSSSLLTSQSRAPGCLVLM